jgi:GNAT superfamily N-acetyltransferase
MITTRPAAPSDIPKLLDGITQLATHHGDTATATAETLARDLFGPLPWMHALMAETGQSVTGYAILLPLAQLQYGKRGMDLHHLFTWPEHRKTGTGRALLLAAQAYARNLGCTYMTVGTHPDNADAPAYYLQHGFTPRAPSPRFALML